MATPKKKKATPLLWHHHPKGGQYAIYKLGMIIRLNGSYSVKIAQVSISVKTLKDAKTMIEAYPQTRSKYHKR